MKITAIYETTVGLGTSARNADIQFDQMTASAVVIVSDCVRDGDPLLGLGFDSIGRYGHGGLLRERFIPRLLAAKPDHYLTDGNIDPVKAWHVVMQNEKPGGHGERSGAVGVLDAALWDLAAKQQDKPLYQLLAQRFANVEADKKVAVYASGGHYHADDGLERLQHELRYALDLGHTRFKIKIGGVPLQQDCQRIDAALDILGDGAALAVDGNGTFDRETAFAYLQALEPYQLAWLEEPADPLDFELHRELADPRKNSSLPIATGENIFSAADTRNLLRYAGLRPECDYLQMDISLSYGIPEYLRMLDMIETAGWSRRRCWPHAGHLFALHVVAGLGLGGHETAIDQGFPFAGFASDTTLERGYVTLGQTPGVGIEQHPLLYQQFKTVLT